MSLLNDNRIDTLHDHIIPVRDSFSTICLSPSCDNFIHKQHISDEYNIVYTRQLSDTAFEQGFIAIADKEFPISSLFKEKTNVNEVNFSPELHHVQFANREILVLTAYSRHGSVLPKARYVLFFELRGKVVKVDGVFNYVMTDPEIDDGHKCLFIKNDRLYIKVIGPDLRRDTIPYPQDTVIYEFRDGKLLPTH